MSNKTINGISNGTYSLELPAANENLDHIRRFISGIAGNMGFSKEHIYQIELIVDEACSNVIKHAYKNCCSSHKIIRIKVKKHPQKIEIVVTDRGAGFDPAAIKTPDLIKYQEKMIVGGLGLYLIHNFCDEVQFSIQPGVRNAVKMVKFLKHPQLHNG